MRELLIIQAGRPVRRVALRSGRTTVGSLGLCDCSLDAAGVAPEHLEILDRGGGDLAVRALSREAALAINGAPRRAASLRPGDVIAAGDALLVVDERSPGADAGTPGSARDAVFAACERVFDLAERLLGERPPHDILVESLDALIALFGASRALLLGAEDGGDALRPLAARGDWPADRQPRMSRTLLSRLRKRPVPVLIADVPQDPTTSAIDSISVEVRSMVVGPLIDEDRLVGVLYLEGPTAAPAFGERERKFLERFCRFSARLMTQARVTARLSELNRRNVEGPQDLADLVGDGRAMAEVRKQIRQVAGTGVTTLVLGESGTGKELVARGIHRLSDRAGRPFVAVNCTALPAELVESELFGHVAGAFAAAQRDRMGRFELAHTGTLFLDEVGDLSPEVQAKLLRALQERIIQRVGEARDRPVDVRIIAATNAALKERIRQGRFREDLFYRLGVFTIRLPPLRERIEDLPRLAETMCRELARKLRRPVAAIDPDALALMTRHSWPGNVRELANVIEQALVREASGRIGPASLAFALADEPDAAAPAARGARPASPDFGTTFEVARARFERWFLEQALIAEAGDVRRVLRRLDMPKGTFYRRCGALGIEPARFRGLDAGARAGE
jgi:transcriptional regulator with GAF, ATPase, and Fis domain